MRTVAPLFSFILSGLGQIYNGQIKKGVIFIIVALVSIIMIVLGFGLLLESVISHFGEDFNFLEVLPAVLLITLGLFVACLNSLLSMLDAYKVAKCNEDRSIKIKDAD